MNKPQGKKGITLSATKIAVIVLVLIGIGIIYALDVALSADSYGIMPLQHIEQLFIDVNGDGNLDLLISGDVILNQGQPNFPTSQPLSP